MKMNQLLTICGITAALFLSAGSISAQTNNDNAVGGNSDPAQQRFLARMHDSLGFTNETEWNAVEPLVQKVFDAQRDVLSGSAMSRVRSSRGSNGTNAIAVARSGRSVFVGQSTAEAQALQQAVDDNAPATQIDAALAKYKASQKAKQAKLVQAQENLRKSLNKKQEAQATLLRLLE